MLESGMQPGTAISTTLATPPVARDQLVAPGSEDVSAGHATAAPVGLSSAKGAIRQSPIWYAVVKVIMDVLLAAVAIVLLLPIFVLIAVLIKLEDGGPVFYKREIVGRYGGRVYAWKYRTMIRNADEYLASRPELLAQYLRQVKLRHDPRVTRIGAFLRRSSLDELPQLFNVLRGEMSLVGPRMIHPSELERFGALAQRRQQVLPGITGLWQVRGRQALSFEERVRLDQEYLDRRSLWLDVYILILTVPAVLLGRGAC